MNRYGRGHSQSHQAPSAAIGSDSQGKTIERLQLGGFLSITAIGLAARILINADIWTWWKITAVGLIAIVIVLAGFTVALARAEGLSFWAAVRRGVSPRRGWPKAPPGK